MTVYKYEVPLRDEVTLTLPQGAELLHVAEQYGNVCLWARVNPDAPMVGRALSVRGTGHPGADGVYVGTFILRGGALVFHLFDRGEVP